MRKCFILTCIILLVWMPVANVFAATYEPEKPTKIEFFTSDSTYITAGQTAILKWKTVNAKSVTIIGLEKYEEGILPLEGSIEVWPVKTTTYVLVADGAGGTTSSSITVNVTKAVSAVIKSFVASSTNISQGESTTLAWEVENATAISIINVNDNLNPKGSLIVAPNGSTTYILNALGADGIVVSKSVTVNVSTGLIPVGNPLTLSKTLHDWGGQYILDFVVTNESDKEVNTWTLTLKKSEFNISIIWGATMEEVGDYVVIKPLYYNNIIKAGGTASFGFEADGSFLPDFYYQFYSE